MLSYSLEELEPLVRPFCTAAQMEAKASNYRRVARSFDERAETCEGLPIHLHLEPTGDCNLQCPLCPRGRGLIRRHGPLPFAAFDRVFEPLADAVALMIVSGFGEPLLNPGTPRMIGHAARRGVPSHLNTNGTVLRERVDELLDAGPAVINVSMDGAVSQSTHRYSKWHPFPAVAEGVERLRKRKDQRGCELPVISGQFIVTEETVAEIAALESWARSIGVERVKFKRKHQTMPGATDRERLRIAPLPVATTERLDFSPTECSHPWDTVFLSCEGRLGVCSFDPHQLLALPGEDLPAVWNGAGMRALRRAHAGDGAALIEPCSRCNRLPGYLEARA